MFKKSANTHTLIMNEIKDVKTALVGFDGFLRAACTPSSDIETLTALCNGVCKSEGNADLSLRHMIDTLAGESLLPATKKELIDISTECDRIANKCEHASTTLVLQNFRIPAEYAEDVIGIITITAEQFSILESSISQLFSNFRPLLKDHSILDEIRRKESAVDKLEEKIYKSIFANDAELAEKLQLARMIELICDISDIIENIADKIQIMLITRKA